MGDTHRIPNCSNRVSCCQTRQPHRQAAEQVHEAVEQAVLVLWRWLHVAGDEDGDDEGVDGDDTGHDDGDEGLLDRRSFVSRCACVNRLYQCEAHDVYLHDQIRPKRPYACNADAGFRGAVCCSYTCDHPSLLLSSCFYRQTVRYNEAYIRRSWRRRYRPCRGRARTWA